MNTNNTIKIPESFLELMPWFAIGKLPIDAQIKFEKAMKSYPLLQEQLKQEKQMIDLVSADKSLLDKSIIAPQEERLKTVFNIIDSPELSTKENSQTQVSVWNSIIKRLKNVFDSQTPTLDSLNLGFKPQYASAGVLVLSVAVLSSFIVPSQTERSVFIPASAVIQPSDNQASIVNATKTVLLVGFNGTQEELSSNGALKGKTSKVDSLPDKPGFFQVSFTDSMNSDEIKQMIDALLAQKEAIWFAGEAF